MPILPENRDRYPADWHEISQRIRKRDGNRCKFCGVENHKLGGRTADGAWCEAIPTGENGLRLTWPAPGEWNMCRTPAGEYLLLRIVRIVLTVAHLNHTPEDCSDDNLAALCQRCHNLHDAKHRREGIRRRLFLASAAGDLWMLARRMKCSACGRKGVIVRIGRVRG